MNQELQRIDFYGSDLLTVEHNGTLYVAMKAVCESIGLQWEDQFKRVKRHPVLSEGMSMMDIPSQGGNQITLMLTLKMLHGWLFLIDSSRVAPAIKGTVILYQKECFEVLSQYWQHKSRVRETSSSEANCLDELHVFLEVTRGRINISNNGNQHNTVSIPAGSRYFCESLFWASQPKQAAKT